MGAPSATKPGQMTANTRAPDPGSGRPRLLELSTRAALFLCRRLGLGALVCGVGGRTAGSWCDKAHLVDACLGLLHGDDLVVDTALHQDPSRKQSAAEHTRKREGVQQKRSGNRRCTGSHLRDLSPAFQHDWPPLNSITVFSSVRPSQSPREVKPCFAPSYGHTL
jgi:hypothetical protein